MMEYHLTFVRSARKDLEKLPTRLCERILLRIEKLAQSPRGEYAVKLQGYQTLWRIRVGDYRVIYEVRDAQKSVDILFVKHRKDVYRGL